MWVDSPGGSAEASDLIHREVVRVKEKKPVVAYFGEVAAKIIEDETYIPSEKLYRKMVENKYTQKVLATYASEPAYDAGSLVKVRSSQNCPHHRLKGSIALVVSNEGDISSAAKGGRPYTILPFGASKTFRIEERWLKKHKG